MYLLTVLNYIVLEYIILDYVNKTKSFEETLKYPPGHAFYL